MEEVLSNGCYRVVYTDYGNSSVLTTADLSPLPPTLRQIPSLAVRVCLGGVCPVAGDQNWSSEVAMAFSSVVLDKTVDMTVQVWDLYQNVL